MKYVFSIITALAFSCIVKAQSDALSVTDLMTTDQVSADSTQHTFRIYFKLNNAAQCDSAIFLFGTSVGDASVLTRKAVFVSVGQDYALQYNSNNVLVQNSTVYAELMISSSQFSASRYVTFYVRDKSGNYTKPMSTQIRE